MEMEVKIVKAARTQPYLIFASDDDSLTEVLLRLPIKSLLRFKLVSKHWCSLITSPKLGRLRNPIPNPAIGLFCRCRGFGCRDGYGFRYVPFCPNKSTSPPLGMLHFLRDSPDIRILHSCNGLLLCCRSWVRQPYYVYNPTTNYLFTLPKLSLGHNYGKVNRLSIAFDPAVSHHYTVVCVPFLRTSSGLWWHQVVFYSSEAGRWRVSGKPFRTLASFENGVYWNGAVHWISEATANSLYLKIEDPVIQHMPKPPFPITWRLKLNYYFGESCDHLHFIPISIHEMQFKVYEMKRDYSAWFVKYNIDLSAVVAVNPCMIRIHRFSRSFQFTYSFYVFGVVRGKEEEDAFLVLRVPGAAIRYNLGDLTSEKLHAFKGVVIEGERDQEQYEDYLRIGGANGHQFIESLFYM